MLACVRRHDASPVNCFLRVHHFCLCGLQLATPRQHVPPQQHQHLLLTVCVERGADASRDNQLRSVSCVLHLLRK